MKMTSECADYQKKIAAFFLGDLTGEEKQVLEQHLAACPRCRSEWEDYERTVQQLASAGEEPVPRHFFVYPEERSYSPWRLFGQMKPGWQTAVASAAVLFVLLGIAAVSRLQIRSSEEGWAISFGRNDLDVLRKEILTAALTAAEKTNQDSRAAWINEIRNEIASSRSDLTRQQQVELSAALTRMDFRVAGQIKNSEINVKDDTQRVISDLYRFIAQQRAQDLEAINLRLDSTDANNAIKTRQTNEILGTLLQVADLKLR
jgi:hypothetical protein